MDIQKEREAFEATSPFSIYMDKVERDGERYKPVHYKDLDYAQIMSFGWLAWQQAQIVAIPEGFVLVPKEPTQEIYRTFYDAFNSANAGNTAQCFKVAYKAMIEAQEQVG